MPDGERHEVCPAAELPPGERRIVEVDGRSVGVFNVDGEHYALANVCPHQGAPLCEGALSGTVTSSSPGEYEYEREGRVLACPWHGWEFDVTTGESVFNPHRCRVPTFEATVECADAPGVRPSDDPEADPAVETYPVAVERGVVVVYV